MEEGLEKEADKWLVNNLHSKEEDYKQAYLAGAEPREKRIEEQLSQAKTIIQDLLDNSDEYARQRAIDFLKEE